MIQKSRSKNTKSNIIWGTINKLVFIFLPFLVRTALIYSLGVDYVGISGLFSSILQVLSLADMGFASAVVYCMYKPIAEQDNDTICSLLKFYRNIYRVIGTIILIFGIICLPLLKFLIKGNYPVDISIHIVYLIYLFNSVISYFLFAYKKSLLVAYQTKRISDNVGTIVKLFTSFIQILVLLKYRNFYAYVFLIPLSTFVENIACSIVTDKIYPKIKCKGKLDVTIKKDIVERVKGLFIYKVCGATRNSLDNIFISMFLGVTSVGVYSNYYYIMSSVRGFMDVITTSMSASLGNSVATESIDKNYNMLNIFTFLFSWICGWCTICLLCLYQPFMEIWLGKNNMLPFSVVIALCFYFYVWTAGDIRSQYTDASGLWHKEKARSIVETVGNLVLNYALVRSLGILGTVLATGISIVIIGIPWSTKIVFDNYFINKKWYMYTFIQIIYALSTLIVAIITYIICLSIPFSGILELITKGIICLCIPNICYFLLFVKTKIWRDSFEFVKLKILKNNF